MTLTEKTIHSILELQKLYPEKRSALIPALHIAQEERGFLPRAIQNEVAQLFDISPNEVYAVVTFYDMFYDKPVGRHLIHVCKNVSCMLNGSDEILKSLCTKLGIKPGETSADGEFSIIPCECMAACDRAPMLLVDDEVIGPVQEQDLHRILEQTKRKRGHCSPFSQESPHA